MEKNKSKHNRFLNRFLRFCKWFKLKLDRGFDRFVDGFMIVWKWVIYAVIGLLIFRWFQSTWDCKLIWFERFFYWIILYSWYTYKKEQEEEIKRLQEEIKRLQESVSLWYDNWQETSWQVSELRENIKKNQPPT